MVDWKSLISHKQTNLYLIYLIMQIKQFCYLHRDFKYKLTISSILMSRNCILHPNQQLISYCETCKDVTCQLCTQLGPHADIRHQILDIEQAAILRQQFYLAFRQRQINPLRERVSFKLLQMTKKQQNLANQKKVIEKDIKLEFEGIVSRAQQIVSKRIVKKQTQIKKLQQMLNQIDDLTYSFDAVFQFPQMFLLCYKQFHQQLKTMQTLNLDFGKENENIALKTADLKAIQNTWRTFEKESDQLDLPREMATSFAKANQLNQYIQRNTFVNSLIGKAVQNYHQEIRKAKKDVVGKQKKILHLYNDLNAELMSLQTARVCAYCLNPFSMSEVNQPCTHNKSYKSQANYKDIQIPAQVKGSKMHYWIAAKKTQRPIPDLKAHSLIRVVQKKQYLSSLKDLKQVKCKLIRYDIQKGTEKSYLNEFKKDDSENKGKVSPLAFLFLMTNKFQIAQVEVQTLSQLCLSREDGLIDYKMLETILQDPLKLYKNFELQEEELQKSKPIAPPTLRFRY